jgi:hypothetical protein
VDTQVELLDADPERQAGLSQTTLGRHGGAGGRLINEQAGQEVDLAELLSRGTVEASWRNRRGVRQPGCASPVHHTGPVDTHSYNGNRYTVQDPASRR